MTRDNRLLYNTLLAFGISGLAAQPLGSFIPFLRESYGFSYDLAGFLISCQSVGNLATVLLAGFLSFWLGRRRSILVTSVWMAIGYFIIAAGIGTPAILIGACLMLGVARGGNSTFSNTMIGTLPESMATRGYNLLHGAYAVGALLSPILLVLAAGILPKTGWRVMAGVLGAFVVVQCVVYAKMQLPEESAKKSVRSMDRSFLKDPRFWLGAGMLFFYISAEYAIVGWLVTYFQDIGALSADLSQLMNSLLWLVILVGRLIGASITGRVTKRALLLVDGIGFFAFFLLMFFSRTPLPIIIGLMGAGLFMATIYPTAFAFGSACIKGNDVGVSVMMFTGSIGGILTPALVGLVAQYAGIRMGMGVVVVFAGLLLLSILLSVLVVTKRNAAQAGG